MRSERVSNILCIAFCLLGSAGVLVGISHTLVYGSPASHGQSLDDVITGPESFRTDGSLYHSRAKRSPKPKTQSSRKGSIQLVLNVSEDQPSIPSTDLAFSVAQGQQSRRVEKLFRFEAGTNTITVQRKGLYAFVVQVVYVRPAGNVSAEIYLSEDHRTPFRQCLVPYQAYPGDQSPVLPTYGTCKIFATAYLKKGDTVTMGTSGTNSTVVTKPSLTFWQVIRIGNVPLFL